MRAMIKRFLRDKSGTTAVEYGILIVGMSMAIVGTVAASGNSLNDMWLRASNALNDIKN